MALTAAAAAAVHEDTDARRRFYALCTTAIVNGPGASS